MVKITMPRAVRDVAVNEEIKDLFSAGTNVVRIDEPCVQARPRGGGWTA